VDSPPEPGDRRPGAEGRRRLEQAPGDRYGTNAASAGEGDAAEETSGPIRGIVLASVVGTIGAGAAVALFAIASVSAGLLVVSAVTGLFVAEGLRAGGGTHMAPRLRRGVALATAVESVALAQLGIWLYARSEGGALGLIDYLAQTFGPLVPLQFAIAALVAWWSAR
jgi:hypothetical protein